MLGRLTEGGLGLGRKCDGCVRIAWERIAANAAIEPDEPERRAPENPAERLDRVDPAACDVSARVTAAGPR